VNLHDYLPEAKQWTNDCVNIISDVLKLKENENIIYHTEHLERYNSIYRKDISNFSFHF